MALTTRIAASGDENEIFPETNRWMSLMYHDSSAPVNGDITDCLYRRTENRSSENKLNNL